MLPAWQPTQATIEAANITRFMTPLGFHDVPSFHAWTVSHYSDFWQGVIKQLAIQFKQPPKSIVDLSNGIETPRWLPGASMNIADSCFNAPANAPAIIYQDENISLKKMTYSELGALSNRVANGLVQAGFKAGDAIAIAMPMDFYAVAIYLGIIKMGAAVVSIADSFSSQEIATRLSIAKAKAIFTQDVIFRAGKTIPLYQKVIEAKGPMSIVISCDAAVIANNDLWWNQFLSDNDQFTSVARDPMSPVNILFSSGTTGDPKAIVWNHTTAIKAASDAYFHHDLKSTDILAWPTNLGWMMGPWILFAALMNQAALALYTDTPTNRAFGQFIQDAQVTMLGVVPTLVASWHQSKSMEGLNWSKIKLFSSTGECSNPDDMAYLMALAGGKPIIEYCGGTEIGGAYISSTLVQPNYPSVFTTPTMGMNFSILDEAGKLADVGEVTIIPPSMGLSTELLNADHHHVYFENMPVTSDGIPLRRHGDLIQHIPEGYMILGRADDTMNLGGIKISSAEIERALVGIEGIKETAAIAVSPPNNGPSQLVIYAAAPLLNDKSLVMKSMQQRINQHLNPLFKIHDVVFIEELPKTASNKIMRRQLRKVYQTNS